MPLRLAPVARIDPLLEDRGRLEHHHAPRRDRDFLAGLGIAADALALLAHHKRAERGQLHGLAPFEAIRDFLQYHFHESRRFSSRQPDFLVHGLTQVRPRYRLARHRLNPAFGDHLINLNNQRYSHPVARVNGPSSQFPGLSHQRTRAAPQVKPPPIASNNTRSPRLMRPSFTATSSASGIEAADVLPCRSTVVTTFSGAMPSLCAEPSMMRLLAWCGTNQSRSAAE